MTIRSQLLPFTLLGAALIVFGWHPLLATLSLAASNEAYTHILLIFPLSAALIYVDSRSAERKALMIDPQPDFRAGAALMALALALGGYARWGMAAAPSDISIALAMFALVIGLMASVLLCFGARTFLSFLFPLCFLLLIVPLPDFVLNWIVECLQQQSAFAARIMFRAVGVPVTRDGIMLSIPGLDIEVARECSSIRSSSMLMVSTLVFAHLFLRSWRRKALLIAVAIPLSVAKNGLRIFTIAELGTRVNHGYLDGNLHHHGGIIFFAVSVVAVLALLWILRQTDAGAPWQHPP